MTRDEFESEMDRMMDLKSPPGAYNGHWEALKDIPLGMLKAGISHALRTRSWFPTGAELRADVDHIARSRPVEPDDRVRDVALSEPLDVPLPTGRTLRVTHAHEYDCEGCRDSGWVERHCDPEHVTTCGRPFAHDAHTYVVKCLCIATNRTIQRRKAASAKYSQAPEKVSA